MVLGTIVEGSMKLLEGQESEVVIRLISGRKLILEKGDTITCGQNYTRIDSKKIATVIPNIHVFSITFTDNQETKHDSK